MLTLEQLTDMDAAARLGGLLLDARQPGWAWRVDLDNLRMHSLTQCVVGQSVLIPRFHLLRRSTYMAQLQVLGIGRDDQIRYGFSLGIPGVWNTEAWHVLADAWVRQVQARTVTTPAPVNEPEQLTLAV